MKLKKIAATALAAGALGFGALAGAGPASADNWNPFNPFPGPSPGQFQIPFFPSPGQIGQLPFVPPPGQIGHLPFVPPPGHWDKPFKWF